MDFRPIDLYVLKSSNDGIIPPDLNDLTSGLAQPIKPPWVVKRLRPSKNAWQKDEVLNTPFLSHFFCHSIFTALWTDHVGY